MRLLFIPLLVLFCSTSFGQYTQKELELFKIVEEQDSLPRSIFLDSTLLPDMKFYGTNTRNVWSSKSHSGNTVEQFYDIRLAFKTHEEALAFHEKFLEENAEYGPQIKKHKLKTVGASEFKAYEGSKLINSMVKAYNMQMYCFLFVVDNYFVKCYLSCPLEFKPTAFQATINENIQRIQQVSVKG